MENTITKIHSLLKSKEISCTELTKSYLKTIKEKNEKINAFTYITEEYALKTAAEIDKKIASDIPISLLEGVPMALKDNISTKDIRTTASSKTLQEYIPIYDATIWERLKNSGAVLLGKTNLDEFAMGHTTETSVYGATLNPHDENFVAGGSSGGSAAAVASEMAVYSIGTDTGGSIRQPASFCGVVGLKPTYGAISRYGLISYASSFDQIGPITTNVIDCAEVYNAMLAYDKMDATSNPAAVKVDLNNLEHGVKGLKIGIINEYQNFNINSEVKTAFEKSINTLTNLGAEIINLSIPKIEYAMQAYYILTCAEATSNLGRYDGIRYGYKTSSYEDVDDMIIKSRSESFGNEVKRRILLGNYVLSAVHFDDYYSKAQKLRNVLRCSFADAFKLVDTIISPTVLTTPYELGFAQNNPKTSQMADICTVPANLTGLPAMSVPFGYAGRLPIGIQILGNYFEEEIILRVAKSLENEKQ